MIKKTKRRNQEFLLLGLIRTYFPEHPSKMHIVALIYGLSIGGFIGGVTAAGFQPISVLLVLLGVVLGCVVGAGLALSLVPKK